MIQRLLALILGCSSLALSAGLADVLYTQITADSNSPQIAKSPQADPRLVDNMPKSEKDDVISHDEVNRQEVYGVQEAYGPNVNYFNSGRHVGEMPMQGGEKYGTVVHNEDVRALTEPENMVRGERLEEIKRGYYRNP